MKTTYRLITLFLYVLLAVPTTFAQQVQDKPIEARTQDVTIIIQQEHVRFTSQKAVQMMQLNIFNQAGEQVYDSGPMTVPEINWPLQAANGEALKSGLYAYTLTLQESDASTARVRRGHFIVDRAQDRDGKTDKLWVTSQNDSSIGTELTVARNDSGTVAGTSTTSDRANVTSRDATSREVSGRGETTSASKTTKATTEAASGTVGQIAKFINGTDLGNSVMTEKNGYIGIGTTSPLSKLNVQTTGYGITQTGGAVTVGSYITTAAGGSGWFGTKSPHPLNFFTNDSAPRMTIDINGNVGIGISPETKLHVLNTTAGVSAIYGESATAPGVYGKSTSSRGVFGESTSFIGVWGKSTSNGGVLGESIGGSGVFGRSAAASLTAAGVYGMGTGSGSIGVIGESNLDNAVGVYGVSASPGGFGGYFRNTGGGTALIVEGKASIGVLEVTGGSDLAEKFTVEDETKPGMVVAIDPKNGGRLAISRKAYNRRVAGIISGANNLSVGMVLPDLADSNNAQPVALSGRVWVYCDATKSPIQPGDLLTTSATPGHAMKVVNHARAQGAILGKAMTSLKEGKGMVLVLVTLQ